MTHLRNEDEEEGKGDSEVRPGEVSKEGVVGMSAEQKYMSPRVQHSRGEQFKQECGGEATTLTQLPHFTAVP